MKYSRHAEKRQQQRNIPPLIVNWLLDYGSRESSHGEEIVYFTKRDRRLLEKDFGRVVTKRLSDFLDAYLVTDGKTIITVGHRYNRVKRNCH